MRRLQSNLGSAKPYQPKLTIKKTDKNNSESTSKYFEKENTTKEVTKNQNIIESPYKDLVKDQKVVLNDSTSEEGDFKTPEIIKKIKNKHNKVKNVTKKNKNKSKQSNTLVKMLEKQFSKSECNPEHVQMAIALSKSEQPEENKDEEKILNVRATLQQFGFKSNKEIDDVIVKDTKRSKKSKFRFITPALYTKSQESREIEIAKKVSLILSQNERINSFIKEEYDVSSDYLKKFLNSNPTCFFKSSLNLKKEDFYVPILNLPQSMFKCGSLLKDWSKIPGRDKSPCKNIDLIEECNELITKCNETIISLNQEININEDKYLREMSPDLFSSDNEISSNILEITLSPNKFNSIPPSKKIIEGFSASMMSNFKSSDSDSDFETFKSTKGIDHFESFNIDGEELAFSISRKSSLKDNPQITLNNYEIEDNYFNEIPEMVYFGIKDLDSDHKTKLNQSDEEKNEKIFDLTQESDEEKSMSKNDVFDLTQDSDEDVSFESDSDNNFFEHQEYCKMNPNNKRFIEYLDDLQLNNSKLSNNDSFINDLISKPLEQDDEKIKLFEEIFTPKKFKKSLSLEQIKSVRKPSPQKKFKKSLTFTSPCEIKKTLPFYFKHTEQIENDKEISSTNSLNNFESNKKFEENDSSETICISDEEINYSSIYSSPIVSNKIIEDPIKSDLHTPKLIHKRIMELSTPKVLPPKKIDENCSTTPDNVVFKIRDITPIPDYDRMNTPTIADELDKVGVKNLKRHRGVQILKHIYYSTHPLLENGSDHNDESDDDRCVKRRKSESNCDDDEVISEDLMILSQKDLDCERVEIKLNEGDGGIEIVGDIPESNELIFERKSSKKIYSCALPLHIAWFNFLTSNPKVKENVLLYIPLQLEVLYEMLKEQGFKYHIQDLLTFLDKKCITIRTNQQGGRKQLQRKNND